jgi:hypothetical protein
MQPVNISKLRAWWFDRQGLANPNTQLTSSTVLANTGWARSVGGANPYVTLFARAGVSREQVDLDIRNEEIHELPSARGCTYVVPRQDYALALTVGQGFSDESAMATARKFLGVTDQEIDRLMTRVEEALSQGPLDPRQIKDKVGDASRSLGEEGKKRGQTTTLPLALGFLQSQGRIRRIPIGGRIDQQRYMYQLWSPSPLDNCRLEKDEAYGQLARKYFGWAGPATADHFRWFSGLGVKVAKEAIDSADLVEMDGGFLLPKDLVGAFEDFRIPSEPIYALVSSIDSHLLLRRDLPNLISSEDAERRMADAKGLVKVSGLQDLSNQAILDRGRVVGIWEYDSVAQEIVWHSFVPVDEALRKTITRTEEYIRSDLGDMRSFSLDSPASREPVIRALRSLK